VNQPVAQSSIDCSTESVHPEDAPVEAKKSCRRQNFTFLRYMDRLQRAQLEQLPIVDLRTLYQEFLGNEQVEQSILPTAKLIVLPAKCGVE
jgi:hypothetical protein